MFDAWCLMLDARCSRLDAWCLMLDACTPARHNLNGSDRCASINHQAQSIKPRAPSLKPRAPTITHQALSIKRYAFPQILDVLGGSGTRSVSKSTRVCTYLRGAGDSLTWKYKVSWFLVSWLLGFKDLLFLGFLVSCFFGFLFLCVSWFQRLLVSWCLGSNNSFSAFENI